MFINGNTPEADRVDGTTPRHIALKPRVLVTYLNQTDPLCII